MTTPSPAAGHQSCWTQGRPTTPLHPLTKDVAADVCVIGAGIAGLTTAYHLAQEGRAVVLLEQGGLGTGETGRTTAHLTAALDDRYEALERLHGEDGIRLAASSHEAAIRRIEEIVEKERLACDFERVDGYLFASPQGKREDLDRESLAARKAGLGVELVARAPIESFDTGPALRFPRQAQFHPLRYMDGLAAAFQRLGGVLHTGTHAKALEREAGVSRVVTKDGPVVTAGAVVVATNTSVFDLVAVHTKQTAYRSYVVVLPIASGAAPRLLLWDTGEGHRRPFPYHYVRVAPGVGPSGSDALIVGGEDHKTGQDADEAARWTRLEAWARERFPVSGPASHRWSGQIMEPVDGLGFVGKDPGQGEGVYVVTGDSGNGITNGTLAGMLLADLVMGRSNPWSELYAPSRKNLKSLPTYVRENLSVAGRYGDWIRAGDGDGVSQLKPGDGILVLQGTDRFAVHRDDAGELHVRSAVCPHLGCLVQWNAGERSWDCPCHGSRFDPRGRVLNGPANGDLPAAKLNGDA